MPKAARARVASPPAGTALARATWECLPGRVRKERGSEVYVTATETIVNKSVMNIFTLSPCGRGKLQPQIGAADFRLGGKLRRPPLGEDAAFGDDVCVIAQRQSEMHILLDEQNR